MLNEFTYCARLGYLEFVHGEWEDNLETKQGSFGHRRVDKADRKNIPGVEHETSRVEEKGAAARADTIHARSILLSAPDEGLIAKLDVLELEGTTATPVDYKRGRAPKVPEGAYEPERVQVCAQGLILRENGFQSDEGVLYFIASKKRVTIPFDDELIARTRQLLEEFRKTAAETYVPPPLVDSPKCPRCSLVGICLPDEVTFLKHEPGTWTSTGAQRRSAEFGDALMDAEPINSSVENSSGSQIAGVDVPMAADSNHVTPSSGERRAADKAFVKPPVRKLLPARSNALPLYIQEQGAMLCKTGDRLQIKKKGEVLGERRLMDVSQVSLFGSVMVSAQALREVTSRGIPVCHFSYGGWFHSMTTGLVHKNVQLRIQQYAIAADSGRSIKIARQLISGKIRNCRTLLRRHLSKTEKPLLDQLDRFRRKAEVISNCESLLGIEGMAAKVYFSGLFKLLGEQHGFDANDRNRRPPRDPVNAVLSFAYALLTKELTVVLQAVGLDPMLGVFHRPRYGRPSLALDLAEEYRPLIADSVMIMAFNNGELDRNSFLERAGAVTLTQAGRSALIATFERRMNTEITHPIFGYRVSYRRLLEVQSRLLARTILGELEEYPAFCTR
ncbi:MAG: CRISPR-associated endonuclease Cas1 [Fuerstiella sp.]